MAIDFNNTPSNKNLSNSRANDTNQIQTRNAESVKNPPQMESAKAASVTVSISSEAKSYAKYSERLENRAQKSPAFDKEKVATIKSAIEDGRYSINTEKLAKKIIEHELDLFNK